jgi:hypothetical protein
MVVWILWPEVRSERWRVMRCNNGRRRKNAVTAGKENYVAWSDVPPEFREGLVRPVRYSPTSQATADVPSGQYVRERSIESRHDSRSSVCRVGAKLCEARGRDGAENQVHGLGSWASNAT